MSTIVNSAIGLISSYCDCDYDCDQEYCQLVKRVLLSFSRVKRADGGSVSHSLRDIAVCY